ncbi:hypothetical protein [Streptomyces ziwulingensis]|uniref:Uncharacterized protein n=1 Tax=Streptomyces ziwulingensis TaxID=1045501 RepID=A0ABP9CV61_9ACTN
MTSRFPPTTLPGTGKDLLPDIDAWITSEAMRALVAAFAGDPAALSGTPDTLLERIDRLLAFTGGVSTRLENQERHEAGELPMTPEQAETVLAAAAALRLCDRLPPSRREYDHVIMLGGLIRACFNRPAYAARLIGDGTVTAGAVTALGGHRDFKRPEEYGETPVTEREHVIAERLGHPGLKNEYAALDLGTRLAFGLGDPEHEEGEDSPDPVNLPGLTWGVRHYRTPRELSVRVAAAPSQDPPRRAHTGETYAFFAERMAALRPGTRLLLVTTPLYKPMQHFTAVRMLVLPYGAEVETVGGDVDRQAPVLRQPFTPTKYLNEIPTTLRALRGLAAAAREGDNP